ncbi:MAG: sensor histidine kinase [Ruminococcus sp.]|uniref:sensor histidine kinase n=1 Tax=Ruminococcus sp. TaxID=41978 RepID=UPI0025CC44F5|nr:histidine kinase dimerization/phospho-acceptor domain-containing protein [Ruminococcus sp.]MBO4867378.1 sensor histidine kinase [Ruminococcus sp.]
MIAATVILGVICAALLIYLLLMKHQLRVMRRELERTAEFDYDRQLLISLFDSDMNDLAGEINKSIEHQKKLKLETEQAEISLRQSVSDIAHDLRTPLAVMKGDLQLILRDNALSENCRGYAEICLEKTERLKEMCDEFFELAVLESESGIVDVEKINLTNLLMSFIAENEGMIRLSGLEPEISLPPKTVFVLGDTQLVGRMLGNLLGNVLKYSREYFTLTLTEDGCLTISNPISGNIPEPDRLFERTYRADRARGGKGAGLGLYIVKLLAQKQGAEVSADVSDDMLSVTVKFSQGE